MRDVVLLRVALLHPYHNSPGKGHNFAPALTSYPLILDRNNIAGKVGSPPGNVLVGDSEREPEQTHLHQLLSQSHQPGSELPPILTLPFLINRSVALLVFKTTSQCGPPLTGSKPTISAVPTPACDTMASMTSSRGMEVLSWLYSICMTTVRARIHSGSCKHDCMSPYPSISSSDTLQPSMDSIKSWVKASALGTSLALALTGEDAWVNHSVQWPSSWMSMNVCMSDAEKGYPSSTHSAIPNLSTKLVSKILTPKVGLLLKNINPLWCSRPMR